MNTHESRPETRVALPSSPPAIHSQILARSISLLRGFTGVAGVLSVVVLAAEATLPAGHKPSDLIGGFHGRVEGADANAKAAAVTSFTRQNAEAAAQPPAVAAMETEAFRQQQQVLVDSMQTKSSLANTADAACVAGQIIPHDNRDWGWLGTMLSQTCGVGDKVRGNMMSTLRRGGQDNSVLIQRPRAGGND